MSITLEKAGSTTFLFKNNQSSCSGFGQPAKYLFKRFRLTPGEGWHSHPSSSVHNTKGREEKKESPPGMLKNVKIVPKPRDPQDDPAKLSGASPKPEYKEVLLVEKIVPEDAEEVASIQRPSCRAVPQCASNLKSMKILFFTQKYFSLTSVGKSSHMGSWVTNWPMSLTRLVVPRYSSTLRPYKANW